MTFILLCFFFLIFEHQGSTNVSVKFMTIISNGSGEIVDFDIFCYF